MHEMAIATSLLEHVLAVARENGAVAIDEVDVEVGVLQQVVSEALQAAFAAAAEGTPAAGAALRLVPVPAVAECRPCGRRFEPALDDYLCPQCRRADVRILAGRDVVLRTVVCRTEDGGRRA